MVSLKGRQGREGRSKGGAVTSGADEGRDLSGSQSDRLMIGGSEARTAGSPPLHQINSSKQKPGAQRRQEVRRGSWVSFAYQCQPLRDDRPAFVE